MPKHKVHSFYKGIAKDDYVVEPWTYLYWNNVDGSIFWYWLTISRKSRKLISTNHPIYNIWWRLHSSGNDGKLMVWHDGVSWYIYNFDSSDSSPEVTVTSNETIHNLLTGVAYQGDYIFIGHRPDDADRNAIAWASNEALTMNYDLADEVILNDYIPPIISSKWLIYIGWRRKITTVDTNSSTPTLSTNTFITDDVTSIVENGTTILIFTDDKRVATWDGVLESITWSKNIWYKVIQSSPSSGQVYWISQDWHLLRWNWYEFTEMYRQRKTLKAESSTEYYKLFDVWVSQSDVTTGNSIESIDHEIYFIEWWKRIWKISTVRPDLSEWYHTILDRNHNWDMIDRIYCIRESWGNLYYSYKAWSTYWVDYIDLSSLESHSSWTVIFTVLRSEPDYVWKENKLDFTISNLSENGKSIDLYSRIDWSEWESLWTYTSSDRLIKRIEKASLSRQFIDHQFKMVLHNTAQDDKPPILHSATLTYSDKFWNDELQ